MVTAYVLSFYNMAKKFESLVYDYKKKDAFIITRDDGSSFKFVPSPEGLYYYNFVESIRTQKEMLTKHVMIVDSVHERKRNYMKRELDGVEKASRMYVTLGRSSENIFESIAKKGKTLNNPVTVTDYRNAIKIYGKDLGSIKGKTTRKKTQHVQVDFNAKLNTREGILFSQVIL
jgi:hypothetical protein